MVCLFFECKIVGALQQQNGWSCGDHMIFAAFKFFFGELNDIMEEWNLHDLYPFVARNKDGFGMFNRMLRYYVMFIVTHSDEEVLAHIQSKQKTMYFDKHTLTMKDDYNFLIQVYRISDPNLRFKRSNFTSNATKLQQGGDGFILKSNQSVAGREIMKLLKDSFKDEFVNSAVCESLTAHSSVAGLLRSGCHFSYKSMKHCIRDFSGNPSKFVFGISTGLHAIDFLCFGEECNKFERYMCIIPYGHAVRYNAIHGESSVAELNHVYKAAGAKTRVMCTIGDTSEHSSKTEYMMRDELHNAQDSNSFNCQEFPQLVKTKVPTKKFLQKSFFDVRRCTHVVDEDVKVLNNWFHAKNQRMVRR